MKWISHTYIHMYMYPLPLKPPSHHPSPPPGSSPSTGWVPCAVQQLPASDLFHTCRVKLLSTDCLLCRSPRFNRLLIVRYFLIKNLCLLWEDILQHITQKRMKIVAINCLCLPQQWATDLLCLLATGWFLVQGGSTRLLLPSLFFELARNRTKSKWL